MKLSSNHKSLLGIIDNNSILIYKFKKQSLSYLSHLSKKINAIIKDELLVNINISTNKTITIVTKKNIYFISEKGKLNTKINNTKNINLIDSTEFSDIIIGSKQSKLLYKYTQDGTELFNHHFNELNTPPINFNIYKPYGDFIIFNLNEGAYYSMRTSIRINSCAEKIMKNVLSISCNINLTFPSAIESTITNTQNKTFNLKPHKLKSGNHTILWKNIPLDYKNSSIEFLTKGLYSNQNIIKKTYKLNVKK